MNQDELTKPLILGDEQVVDPGKKIPISLRIDGDVLAWYKAQPGRYQKRINQVLRQYMLAKQQSSR